MTFEETLVHVRALLEREGRVAYCMLKRRFALDDDDVEDLKADLIEAKHVAVDKAGKVLVWAGGRAKEERGNGGTGETEERAEEHPPPQAFDSAHAMKGDKELCLATGMDGYVSQPLKPGDLRTALERVGTATLHQGAAVSPPTDLPETAMDHVEL
jgi:hypothetical protein